MPKPPSDKVSAELEHLEADEKAMLECAHNMLKADDQNIYMFDLLANAAINRSVALSSGFRTLIRDQNLICAGALLRLQLDTAIRFFAGFLVEQPHEFAAAVLKGKHIRKMKDRKGNPMTDRYLVTLLGKKYPWIEFVYEKTSGYIHLSNTHIFSTLEKDDQMEKGHYLFKLGASDNDLPDELYLEAIAAFRESTIILVQHIDGWTFTKENPEIIAAMKSKT
ncbi:MAG: hypothetical protein OXC42_08575 [Gammaproteobacteria bacterium]|nr:hypothetical protein [Gammaproteobacteria bacterium]